jgi:hypothetical protein
MCAKNANSKAPSYFSPFMILRVATSGLLRMLIERSLVRIQLSQDIAQLVRALNVPT